MKSVAKKPPRVALQLLKLVTRSHDYDFALGDMTEIYDSTVRNKNVFSARCWLWLEILRSLPGFATSTIYWGIVMFKSHFKTAWRNILRHKGYSFINIAGLAIGLACCLLIAVWILDELSYDKFHADSDRVLKVLAQEGSDATPNVLGPALERLIPEIQYATRVDWLNQSLVSGAGDTSFEWIVAVDPSFFDVFSFPFARGNASNALADVSSIVITQDVAERFFPHEDAVGKVLTMDNRRDFLVTGVIENVPHNSSLQFDMLVPFENKIQSHKERGEDYASWGWWSTATYVKIHDGVTLEAFNDKIRDFIQKQVEDEDAELQAIAIEDVHLYGSNIRKYLYSFSMIAVIILIMACINFVNLSIARSASRARETGIRKVSGALRGSLIGQFYIEYLVVLFIALLLAIGLLELLLPIFNATVGMNLSADLLFDSFILPMLVGLALVTSIAAGAYPALYLSAFQPVAVLKGSARSGSGGSKLRKALVVVQFTASVFLIIGTFVVYAQLEYIKNRDIGYDKAHIVNISLKGDTNRQYYRLKNDLLHDSRIQAVTASAAGLPYWRWTTDVADWPGKNPAGEPQLAMNMVSYDFTETFGIDMIEGRDFSPDYASDSTSSYVVNEEMVKLMGLQSAIGADLTIWNNPGKIIGVMKDFHFRPLNSHIQPLVFVLKPEKAYSVAIRIRPEDISGTLGYIEATWKRIIPEYPFDYAFLDEQFDGRYRGVERMGDLAGGFSLLAIFIACLGLFGLASFTAEQRTKEIGIRKVLGASGFSVVQLLSREFITLVVIAVVVAWPLAWIAMNRWLEDFAYHVDLGWSTFVLAGFLALFIALLTISGQAIRAARDNPVRALKYE
jgi:predicted permease